MNVMSTDRVRQRAFALWEEEGQPEVRATEHWLQAERELGEEPVDRPIPAAEPERPLGGADPDALGTLTQPDPDALDPDPVHRDD
jgi:hypothetical protein